jgi:hypothetical protein
MEDHPDGERRQLQRFLLKAPAIVKTAVENQDMVSELFTRDISSGGAFFQTDNPLPAGSSVEITLFLLTSAFRAWRGRPYKVKITTGGTVVRTEDEGMAVAFSEQYRMVPVPA